MTKEQLTMLMKTKGIIHFALALLSFYICDINLSYGNNFYSINNYQYFFRVLCFRGCT